VQTICCALLRSMMASPAATGDSVCDYFFSVSGVVLGPGTAGDVLSPGRTGAGVIVSGLVVGVGGALLSRLQPDNDNAVKAMQVQMARRFMAAPGIHPMVVER
jgi:hypothetical protein